MNHGAGTARAEDEDWSCPLPESHDRFNEAHYYLHQIEQHYHNPQTFRYSVNAYIAALRAVHELLAKELERNGEIRWWKDRRKEFVDDDVLSKFARGRNIALHQRPLVRDSQVSIGLFRGRRLKLAMQLNVKTDEPSQSLLERVGPKLVELYVGEEHSALGEQIGVQRLYFVRELSDVEDVLRASRRALARTSRASAEAHNRLGADHTPASDDDVVDDSQIESVTVLLESDLDPEAPARWGWV